MDGYMRLLVYTAIGQADSDCANGRRVLEDDKARTVILPEMP